MDILNEFSFLEDCPYFARTCEESDSFSYYFHSVDEETGKEFPMLVFLDISKSFKSDGVSTDEGFCLNRFPWFDVLYKEAKNHYKEKNRIRFLLLEEQKKGM